MAAIGETILGAVLQVVIDKLASPEVISFFKRSKFDKSLVENLQNLMLATEKLLYDAEEKQMTHPAVENWLDNLKHWFYRAEEVVDELATEALRSSLESPRDHTLQLPMFKMVRNMIPALSTSYSFEKTITVKMKKVVIMLDNMLKQRDALGLRELSVTATSSSTRHTLHRMPTTSLLEDSRVFGRDQEKEQILEFLLSEQSAGQTNQVGVVAIVGMGGLGKTTLAKLVYNDEKLNKFFDFKVWVCVSEKFDVPPMTQSILESISGQPYSGLPNLDVLQNQLSAKLKGKKILLVMDDVWNENYENWERLRAPFSVASFGSKIIVTTRNDGVAFTMQTTPMLRLKPLTSNDGWSLFKRHAFELANSSPTPLQEKIGLEIVKKCQGLPLAIKTLGGVLRFKQEGSEWEAILQSSLWNLAPHKSNVLPALRLSYYHLPPHLKRCFSYLPIYPKDSKINVLELVSVWMAENFVRPTNNERRIEDVGLEYLRQLISRSFLEQIDESYVKMHHLMQDLAENVSGSFFTRANIDCQQKAADRVRYFSYILGNFDGITRFQAIQDAKFLQAIIQMEWPASLYRYTDHHVSSKVTTSLLPQLHYLRVLCLTNYENLILPESIGNLKQLRLLNVSNTKIKQLPEAVSTLYNLQTLVLSKCSCLERLPTYMSRLVFLRHLNIAGTKSLLHMPMNMSKLKSLQTLTDFVVGKENGAGIKELKELTQIRGKLALRQLQNVKAPVDTSELCLSEREYLEELTFEFGNKDNDNSLKAREVVENLKPPANLKRLTIANYVGTRFPSWLDCTYLVCGNITFLHLAGCLYCQSLPPLGQFSSLKELEIEGMNSIVMVSCDFYGRNLALSSPFPVLERLSFNRMKNWEEWTTYDASGGGFPFPHLRSLYLSDCPKLQGQLPDNMPSLMKLQIDGCEQLALPSSLQSMQKLALLELSTCPVVALSRTCQVTSITRLRLEGLVHLVNLPPELVELSLLRELRISCCENLKSLTNIRLPPKLESLSIIQCKVLQNLPNPEDMRSLTHLKAIRLDQCPALLSVPMGNLPSSLEILFVGDCEMCEFLIPVERSNRYDALEYLLLMNVPLVSFQWSMFPNLKTLYFFWCKDLEKVHFAEENNEPNNTSNCLESLSTLIMYDCPKVEITRKATGGAAVLRAPNLSYCFITGCDNVKEVAIDAFPSKLCELSLDYSNRSTSPLRFTSNFSSNLTRAIILRHPTEECIPFPDKSLSASSSSVSLHASLMILTIGYCPKLRYLDGNALSTLTALLELIIVDCPELQSLPVESLPSTLVALRVRKCPKLQGKCQKETGQYWPHIQHLPFLHVDDDYPSFHDLNQQHISRVWEIALKDLMEDYLGFN